MKKLLNGLALVLYITVQVSTAFPQNNNVYEAYKMAEEFRWLKGQVDKIMEKRNYITDYVEREDDSPVKYRFTYDKSGKLDTLIKTLSYDDSDIQKRHYNTKGQLTWIDVYDTRFRQMMQRIEFKYDTRGHIKKKNLYNTAGIDRKNTIFYQPKSMTVVEILEYPKRGSTEKVITTYDNKGNEIRELVYAKSGSKWNLIVKNKFEYQFDFKGNWTKKTEFRWGTKFEKSLFEPIIVFRRIIDYL